MQTDYLIIGQGLCGSWLSYYLLQAGASVLVVDKGTHESASNAASGIINPITGKRLARQWMADSILPFAKRAYDELSIMLSVPLARELPVHTFFSTGEEASFFEQKANAAEDGLLSTGLVQPLFNYHYGVGTIYPAMLVDVRVMLERWRMRLTDSNSLKEEQWDWKECAITNSGVRYKEITAKAVIDCSGAAAASSPYFSALPFALNKGEAIIAAIHDLPPDAIYKYAQLSLVPWTGGRFWIGSTFDWDFTDELPTKAFCSKAESILRQWLRVPFTLQEHFAAIRPATVTRDAFAGLHPYFPQIGILDGTGSKGCSLAPFLAHNLAQHLTAGISLIPQSDTGRYRRALALPDNKA